MLAVSSFLFFRIIDLSNRKKQGRVVVFSGVMWLSENERIRHRITDMYADFVRQVDPRGNILDLLIQRRVVNEEVAERLRRKETRQDRCRSLLHELLNGGNPEAFIVLRTALQEDYRFVVNTIDEATTGRPSTCFTMSRSYILRESWTTQNVLWSRASVCLCVCPRLYTHSTARTRM